MLMALVGCQGVNQQVAEKTPVFSLAWSEYPSWSVFGVAAEKGLIDPVEGKLGSVEKKWNVDIVLKEADYDTCITMYGSNVCDAVCITNMDAVNPSLGRKTVMVLPTSTSDKADACIVVNYDGKSNPLDFLKKKKVFGLKKSVSEYVFACNIEKLGGNPKDFQFANLDPAAAATALQTNQSAVEAIMVWNPFVLQTLRTRKDAKVIFDSGPLKEEIIDGVGVSADTLNKEGGQNFACAICDCYYQMNKMLADPKVGDETLVALGSKFSNLNLEDMKIVVDQTKFYKTPESAEKLFASQTMKNTMQKVVKFCVDYQVADSAPTVGVNVAWNSPEQLVFTTDFIKKVK
jgi:ABC-type nitrate/sulfonate/bicarbonate transport system substrate-binding protein